MCPRYRCPAASPQTACRSAVRWWPRLGTTSSCSSWHVLTRARRHGTKGGHVWTPDRPTPLQGPSQSNRGYGRPVDMCGPQIVSDEDKTRIAAYQARFREVTHSPFGRDDQIGMLNLITMDSVSRVLSEIDPGRVFDLATDYFVGMPNWMASGDPAYQIWMSHTPNGTVLDDLVGVGREENELVSYSGDCIAMY